MRHWILPTLLGVALLLPELLRNASEESRQSRALKEQIEGEINRNFGSDSASPESYRDRQYGVVRVTGTSQPLPEEIIQQIVAKRSTEQSAYVSVWNWQGIPMVTASARGLDSKHHFANSYLVGFSPFKTRQLWVPLYTLAIRKEYQYDHLQYAGLADIWQTSRQAFYQKRGDCEDHAILLADWLIELGVDARVALGTHNGQGHAWVVAIVDNREYLLEATSKRRQSSWQAMPLAELAEGYEVEFQFNRNFFWAKKDSSPTRKYRGSHWVKKSQFIRS
ncbi:transglutaminase-like domain-containing protein [Microbulbifer marinus]|uniref:Transglutaminase-like superfamily protein n=1 Tax=Microbulbifer marinus TaxID=658218 RepID=A0A1H3YN18_9GAMM|nr:transglutaminase-like domain-containing protein [Microbulbifer marinus]SEA12394.1 Transglutaminase-like superfamily protein [Microbulbifer marinus]